MENRPVDYNLVNGWGIDADPKNDPTYPMRKRSEENHEGYTWDRPPLQSVDIEVLHSVERPNVTAVFGTSKQPTGLSGKIRRYAFQYGEGSFAHWLPLVLADRVNVVEGIIEDLKQGHFPNIWAERGMNASWKYNKASMLKSFAITAAVTAGAVMLLTRDSKGKKKKAKKSKKKLSRPIYAEPYYQQEPYQQQYHSKEEFDPYQI